MNKPAKTAFAVAIAALAIVPKAHATTNEESAVIADGIATHGSIVCNPAWLDRICVLAWQGHRGEKLHLREDAGLMASELNREWPSIEHWAAPATADEIRAHATQAARLMARAA